MSKNNFHVYNDKIIENTANNLMNENLIDIYQLSQFNFIHIKYDEKLLFFINVNKNKIFYLPIIVKRVKDVMIYSLRLYMVILASFEFNRKFFLNES